MPWGLSHANDRDLWCEVEGVDRVKRYKNCVSRRAIPRIGLQPPRCGSIHPQEESRTPPLFSFSLSLCQLWSGPFSSYSMQVLHSTIGGCVQLNWSDQCDQCDQWFPRLHVLTNHRHWSLSCYPWIWLIDATLPYFVSDTRTRILRHIVKKLQCTFHSPMLLSPIPLRPFLSSILYPSTKITTDPVLCPSSTHALSHCLGAKNKQFFFCSSQIWERKRCCCFGSLFSFLFIFF